MTWMEEASDTVTFYFKDTMPADVEVPGGTDIPTGAPGGGGGGGGGLPDLPIFPLK